MVIGSVCAFIVMPVSAAVQAANTRLLALRQQQVGKGSPSPNSPCPQISGSRLQLPPHLGWGSAGLTAVLAKPEPTKFQALTPKLVAPYDKEKASSERKTLKHFPSLGIAALKKRLVPHYQLWMACRWLDTQGRGWLDLEELKAGLTGNTAVLHLFSWRRVRQLLLQGSGLFWHLSKKTKRIWLNGAGTVAQSICSRRLSGTPVLLEKAALMQGIGTFKAHLYAAWHSGRKNPQPISRHCLQKITGVPQRTQRHYEKAARVAVKPNLAIGDNYCAQKQQERAWSHGGALFKFVDWHGRVGRKNAAYFAWQLPNSYAGPHQTTAFGQQKRINRCLTDLVHKGAQGNGEQKIERLYYNSGKEAAAAFNNKMSTKAYWSNHVTHQYHWWHLFF